jgi:hypothetical protein
VRLVATVGLRLLGRGVRSQNVSGTNKKSRAKHSPTIIATILKTVSLPRISVQDCLPENPSPAQALDDDRAHQWHQVLST